MPSPGAPPAARSQLARFPCRALQASLRRRRLFAGGAACSYYIHRCVRGVAAGRGFRRLGRRGRRPGIGGPDAALRRPGLRRRGEACVPGGPCPCAGRVTLPSAWLAAGRSARAMREVPAHHGRAARGAVRRAGGRGKGHGAAHVRGPRLPSAADVPQGLQLGALRAVRDHQQRYTGDGTRGAGGRARKVL